MKRWIYWLKLNDWERKGYDVSELREKYFVEPPNFRWLIILLLSIIIVPLLIWAAVNIIPPEPAIITFVVDTSTSMNENNKLENVKEGLIKALSSMNTKSQAGVLFFDDTIHDEIPVGLVNNTHGILNAILGEIHAQGGAVLYDAIESGIKIIDMVETNENEQRTVVIITDSQDRDSKAGLDDIINMRSTDGYRIQWFPGYLGQKYARDEIGRNVPIEEVIGDGLAIGTNHPIRIYFIGIGNEADPDIGRILTEATNGYFKSVSEKAVSLAIQKAVKW